jgi:SAM-dependent MidA family methyltransferase
LNELAEQILKEIQIQGSISFARFMECALYCPVYGYYEKEEDTLGQRGDYFTSVSVGSLFGELLAFQFAEWLTLLHRSGAELPLQIVEAGAHRGELAKDILTWFRAYRPTLCDILEYCIVEPSSHRQDWQRRTLTDFQTEVRWVKCLGELSKSGGPGTFPSPRPVRGVIFCNELLDAFPVRRLGWDAAHFVWFEWGVTFTNGRFHWIRLATQSSEGLEPEDERIPRLQPGGTIPVALGKWPRELLKALPDGYTIELCPAAGEWWAQAGNLLGQGQLLTIDYGFSAEELFSPARTGGTLRAYRKHRLSSEVLDDPGEQDITAHVNFSAIREAGESAGLTTALWSTQEHFLINIAGQIVKTAPDFADWTAERKRQFQTLTHPNQLGHSFKVLLQSRDITKSADLQPA